MSDRPYPSMPRVRPNTKRPVGHNSGQLTCNCKCAWHQRCERIANVAKYRPNGLCIIVTVNRHTYVHASITTVILFRYPFSSAVAAILVRENTICLYFAIKCPEIIRPTSNLFAGSLIGHVSG